MLENLSRMADSSEGKIRLITVQHDSVLKSLRSGCTYIANNRYVKERCKKAYSFLNQWYGYFNRSPVFAGIVASRVEFAGVIESDCKLIELLVPQSEVVVQDYYSWTDLIYYTDTPGEWDGDVSPDVFYRSALNLTIDYLVRHNGNTYQAVLGYIQPEWVIGSCDLKDKFKSLHINSGGRNILKCLDYYKEG